MVCVHCPLSKRMFHSAKLNNFLGVHKRRLLKIDFMHNFVPVRLYIRRSSGREQLSVKFSVLHYKCEHFFLKFVHCKNPTGGESWHRRPLKSTTAITVPPISETSVLKLRCSFTKNQSINDHCPLCNGS